MRVALAQILATDDPKANLELVRDHTALAAQQGATVVVFPEATMCRFGVSLKPVAEPLDGPWATEVRAIAEQHGVLVVAGMFTPTDDGRVTNTLLAVGRGVDTSYDKIHLYDAFGFAESRTVAPGSSPVVVEVDGETLGLAVCYDVRFPELFRALADRGASTVLLPASWGAGEGKIEQWELLVRARAVDSTTFVVACDQADPLARGLDPGKAPRGVGHSLVASPTGTVVESLADDPGLLVVDVDTTSVAKVREVLPVLANRRL
ncbi:carbon-nitrogen hydrolase family protein [Actinomycetospora sp. NBRC 106378]|uniref:carbon-nitrogen hydrolase family protein n=1 Tax=Actinomycetospora sp. NBRC 106378 TaxID=3032208 RepID=UPI0024A34571|nr:carbon-nitrogen hydrolase family protein [Actinomycetospora sp. NBRC 106378]GLZ52934.1 apolipoprotein acyltransferase [Actinomycetospora sp. NBRC 106378]